MMKSSRIAQWSIFITMRASSVFAPLNAASKLYKKIALRLPSGPQEKNKKKKKRIIPSLSQ